MPWLAEPNVVIRNPEVIPLSERVRIPVRGGCWPLPHMRRHSVQNLHGVSTCSCHRLLVTAVEGINGTGAPPPLDRLESDTAGLLSVGTNEHRTFRRWWQGPPWPSSNTSGSPESSAKKGADAVAWALSERQMLDWLSTTRA